MRIEISILDIFVEDSHKDSISITVNIPVQLLNQLNDPITI